MRRALIAASFGTSVLEAEQDIGAVEQALRAAAPDFTFVRAWTSSRIRNLRAARGAPVDSPEEALNRLALEGCENVVVQPTHFLYGVEYGNLRETAAAFQPQFRSLRLGKPLLCNVASMRRLAEILLRRFSEPEEALVLMGHGTSGFSDIVYPAMETILRQSGFPAYVATVEGWPAFSDLLLQLQKGGLRRVKLVPMMLTAGNHARKDMAGEDPGSWKSQLEAAGFSVRCHMQGLGALPEVQQMYVRLLEDLLKDGI